MSSDELDEDSDSSDDDLSSTHLNWVPPQAQQNQQPQQPKPPSQPRQSNTQATEDEKSSSESTATQRGNCSNVGLQAAAAVLGALNNTLKNDSVAANLPGSSVRLVSTAVDFFDSALKDDTDVNEKLSSAAKTVQFLVEAISAVCMNSATSHELLGLRETTKTLGSIWSNMIPDLHEICLQAKIQSRQAADLEQQLTSLMLTKRGVLELITTALSR
jgi:hypothetical protein